MNAIDCTYPFYQKSFFRFLTLTFLVAALFILFGFGSTLLADMAATFASENSNQLLPILIFGGGTLLISLTVLTLFSLFLISIFPEVSVENEKVIITNLLGKRDELKKKQVFLIRGKINRNICYIKSLNLSWWYKVPAFFFFSTQRMFLISDQISNFEQLIREFER